MRLYLLAFTFIVNSHCFGQYYQIAGKVVDENGTPVPAATIRCIRATSVAWANKEGDYSIITPYSDDTVMCSHINYGEKREIIEGNTTLNFFLQRRSNEPYAVSLKVSGPATNTGDRKLSDSSLIKGWWADRDGHYLADIELGPEYPGGPKVFQKDFEACFSLSMHNAPVTGVARLGISIGKDGLVKNVTLFKGINSLLDEEAMKTVKGIFPGYLPFKTGGM